jgi:hypothetical protein
MALVWTHRTATGGVALGSHILDQSGDRMAEVMRSSKDDVVQLTKGADGRYTVVASGAAIINTSVLSAAELIYDEEVDRRKSRSREIMAKERAHSDMRAMMSESSLHRGLQARKKGGKGGKGGV